MTNNKIALEYTNTSELKAKRDIAVREAKDNAREAYNELHDKFEQLLNKSNVKFHIINLDPFGDTRIYNHVTHEEFFKKYGPNGKLFKISNKATKKFKYCIGSLDIMNMFVQDEAMDWFREQINEDYNRAEKFLNRKSIKNIIAEIKAIDDNMNSIIAHYNAQIKKALEIQQIGADYKNLHEFERAVYEEAKKLGYYACYKNNSFEFHKSLEHGRYSNSITAYATLPYSRKKEKECIIFTNELFEQVMQPLHDAIKIDTSWEDKYKDLFYFNKMKTKVKVHVSDGNCRHWLNHVKEYSKTDFTEVNFKNWLNNVEVNERRHLTNEFLKKARSV